MKHILNLIGLGVVLLAAGCATCELPRGAQVVGGGIQIAWTAPEAGTVLLVEKTTGKTVVTRSLAGNGDSFSFEGTMGTDAQVLGAAFDTMPTNAQFVLYFVPASARR